MTGIDRVGLRVADLDRAVGFYERVVGLSVLARDGDSATLGVDDPLLVLLDAPDAPDRDPAEAGLFHVAFRVPSRSALGDALGRIEDRWTLDGASDHGVSEALYLTDPEDNGMEVYRDRPRESWPWTDDGGVAMDTRPLALDPLREAGGGEARDGDGGAGEARDGDGGAGEARDGDGTDDTDGEAARDDPPADSTVGHVHLEGTSLSAARSFYVDRPGLGVRQSMRGAHFLAFDDYHHHVAVNVWNGRSAAHDPASLGLAWVELATGGAGGRRAGERLTDPDGIRLRLR